MFPEARSSPEMQVPAGTFLLAAVGLAVWVGLVYAPALGFQFILDDHRFLGDVRVQQPGHVPEYFANYVWAQFAGGPATFYRPLFVLWLRANVALCGMSEWGWHLLSVGKHLAAAGALGWLTWRLLRDRWAALVAAGLFALHPAQAESVAWVTVPDPLMAVAVLMALGLWWRSAAEAKVPGEEAGEGRSGERQTRRRKKGVGEERAGGAWIGWTAGAACACLVAMLVKETAALLPVALAAASVGMAVRRASLGEGTARRGAWRWALTGSGAFLLALAVSLAMRGMALGGKLSAATQHLSAKTLVLSAPGTLWFLVKTMAWPLRSHAFADPDEAAVWSARGVLLPAVGVACAAAGLAALLVWLWRRAGDEKPVAQRAGARAAVWMGGLLVVLPLVPVLDLNTLNPGDSLHGRYTYVSLAGAGLLAGAAWHGLRRGRRVFLAAAGVAAVAFTALTVEQERMWRDDAAVFTAAHAMAPQNRPVAVRLARVHVQQAIALGEQGRCAEALPVLEGVTREFPEDWYAWAAEGECRAQGNDWVDAEAALHRAADLSQDARVREAWEAARERAGH